MPDGHIYFNPPNKRNLGFFIQEQPNLHLPPVELLYELIPLEEGEWREFDFDLFQDIVKNAGGFPARLFGLALAIWLGKPWDFLRFSSALLQVQRETKIFPHIFQKSLDELKAISPVAVRDGDSKVIDRTGRFFEILKAVKIQMLKAQNNFPKKYRGGYCPPKDVDFCNNTLNLGSMLPIEEEYRHKADIDSISKDAPEYSSERNRMKRFNKERENEIWRATLGCGLVTEEPNERYVPAKEWIERYKGLTMPKNQFDAIGEFIDMGLLPFLKEVQGIKCRSDTGYLDQ